MKSNRFVKFPPYSPQYYFSSDIFFLNNRHRLFYYPYNKIASLVWGILLRFSLIKRLASIPYKNLPLHIKKIITTINCQEASFQINIGTTGPDQKVTIIRNTQKGVDFFKVAISDRGKALVKNEFEVLSN